MGGGVLTVLGLNLVLLPADRCGAVACARIQWVTVPVSVVLLSAGSPLGGFLLCGGFLVIIGLVFPLRGSKCCSTSLSNLWSDFPLREIIGLRNVRDQESIAFRVGFLVVADTRIWAFLPPRLSAKDGSTAESHTADSVSDVR